MTDRRFVRVVLDTLGVLVSLPVFTVFVLLSPLLKPRGGVLHPRYTFANGKTYKTFLV